MHKLKRFQKIRTNTRFIHMYRGEYDADSLALQHEIASRKGEEKMAGGVAFGHGVDAVCIVPLFENGDDLVCRGVEMEASCIEDSGRTDDAGVCFHVFTYNVQPGIGIDYATGESWVEGREEPAAASGADEEGNAEEWEYAVSVNSGKFHLSDCTGVQKANPDNIKRLTCTREDLTGDGYTPCGLCNP